MTLRIQVAADAKARALSNPPDHSGRHFERFDGLFVDSAVSPEPPGAHETQDSAIPVANIAGRVRGTSVAPRRGGLLFVSRRSRPDADVRSDLRPAADRRGGSAATVANFDPSLSIYDAEGSWFDPKRLKRIAYNDEPVWVFGKSTDAHLVHRFAKAGNLPAARGSIRRTGRTRLQLSTEDRSGRVAPGDVATARRAGRSGRGRDGSIANRLNQLAARGGKPENQKSIETYRAAAEAAVFKLPGTIEGTLLQPGETHRARFHLDRPGGHRD